tara:strand:+ start:4153 stop:5454 length:1302 start_codon:yes stop_codon:yes gene_type:complete
MTIPNSLFNKNLPPLAERVRPHSIEYFIGQDHLIGKNKIINQMISNNNLSSIILWGPPGSGKTTLARIIAKSGESILYEISAVSSGVKDLRKIIDKARANIENGLSSIMFIDEIHRFSKSQQDALLHAVEEGLIILIGATTENPSFEVINPLLSRCKTLKLKSLRNDDLLMILNQSIKSDIILSQKNITLEKPIQTKLIHYCNGDARKMLNAFELALDMSDESNFITSEIIDEVLQSKTQLYDKNSDYHYDVISAFIKSIRGSDPDAAIYWMAIMLEGGEKPEFIIRRLIILASEDIGNADPQALQLAVAGFQAVSIIGMPESAIIMSQVTVYLASAPKSNASYLAINRAQKKARKDGTQDVPLHLRNATTSLMKKENYGKDYKYPHNYNDKFLKENYFPTGKKETFYNPTSSGYENFIRERLIKNWPERYNS